MRTRPTGITIIAVVYLILGFLSLVWSTIMFGFGATSSMVASLFGAEAVASASTSNAWSGFVGVIIAIVQVAVAFGLLSMKRWSWTLAVIGVGVTVLQGLIGMFTGGAFSFMCGSLGLIVPAIILFYLLRPSTRAVFDVAA